MTELLQGKARGRFGAIWQVLPTFEHLLRHFEDLRVEYPVTELHQPLDPELLNSQHHFSTSINLGWQKLN